MRSNDLKKISEILAELEAVKAKLEKQRLKNIEGAKRYYQVHKEEIRIKKRVWNKNYWLRHKEERKEYQKKYWLEHLEELRAKARARYHKQKQTK